MALPEWLSWLALGFLLFLLYRSLFVPALSYKVQRPIDLRDEKSVHALAAIADSAINQHTTLEVYTDGKNFYHAELQAIRQAEKSVNVEAYIFTPGEIGEEFAKVLSERARAGVQVNLHVDAVGSYRLMLHRSILRRLHEYGCQVRFYHPLRVKNLERFNVRTHREIMVVDGRVAFIGGAGVADHWYKGRRRRPAWRDMMVRVEGPAVASLQGAFVENWVESEGEVLTGPDYFPELEKNGEHLSLVITSSSKGRSTHARIVHQVLMASAGRKIYIATPYFIPDSALRRELIKARQRGVDVRVITCNRKSDHLITRRASQRLYGELLKAGIEIYEYGPAMYHVKMMLVDDEWAIAGTTNFDHRSFSINDEIILAVPGGAINERLERDYVQDLKNSRLMTYESWLKRPLIQRAHEQLSRILERQQ